MSRKIVGVTVGTPISPEKLKEKMGLDPGGNVDQTAACENLDLFYSAIIRRKANPKEPLAIKTYPGGNDQPTHPKVLYFENGWNGHKYWMVYTPYPNNNSFHENPCITYSDDGINWSEDGISNPIIASEHNGCWWSDPHLVYIPSTNTMELWVRWCSNGADGMQKGWEGVYRLKSTDGVNWSEKEYLYHVIDTAWASVLSPSVIYEDGKYKIWFCYKRECLKYYESADGTNWQYVKDISKNLTPLGIYKLWHFDMIKTDKGYEFVGCYQPNGAFNQNNYIAYSWSANNHDFAPSVCVLDNGASGQFDDMELYRPSLVKVGNKYRMYYGAQKNIRIWHVGVVEAPKMELLHELLAANSAKELPTYSADDDETTKTNTTAENWDLADWEPGYFNDSGTLVNSDAKLNMHRSSYVPIREGGTVTTAITSGAYLRISYFDADYSYLTHETGGETGTRLTIRTDIADAVYYAVSCNTDNKNDVAVATSGSSGGDDSGGETETTHTITNTLSNVTTSNNASSVIDGERYTATLTIASGFDLESVTVFMGGVNITETAYSNGVITIANVTGNVVITAIAVEQDLYAVADSFEDAAWVVGYFNDTGAYVEVEKNLVMHHSQLVPVGDTLEMASTTAAYPRVVYFDENKEFVAYDKGNGANILIYPEKAAYYSVCANTADKSQVSIVETENVELSGEMGLFYYVNWVSGEYLKSNQPWTIATKEYIPVNPGETYFVFVSTAQNIPAQFVFYDENKAYNFDGNSGTNDRGTYAVSDVPQGRGVIVPDGCAFMRFHVGGTITLTEDIKNDIILCREKP